MADQSALSSRAVQGMYFEALEAAANIGWLDAVSNYFTSDQASETYPFLGMPPALREFLGGHSMKGLSQNEITIINRHYEASFPVQLKDLRRDKTGQIRARMAEFVQRGQTHFASLLSALIIAGEATACYDGQYFFDTDHSEGDSGSQSNDISVDITTTTAPTGGEMETGILKTIETILGFKDDQGEPMNENARAFTVMVPVPFMSAAAAAIGSEIIIDSSTSRTNRIMTMGQLGGFRIDLAVNARLTWTTKFATFRTDCETKSLIRQEEEGVTVDAIAEGSELEFNERKHRYGVKAIRNVGYGYWQRACLATFT